MHSSRSKAESEPVQISKSSSTSLRPSSSYDASGIRWDSGVSFDSRMIEFIASELGIDLETSTCTWIVRDCLMRLLENNWVVEGSIFRHKFSGEKRSTNEIVETHRQLAIKVIEDTKSLALKREDPQYRIKECVYNKISSVETVFKNLNLHVKSEFYLIPIVTQFLDFSLQQYLENPHLFTVDSCCDIQHLITLISLERVLFLKYHFGILHCVNCSKLADGICGTCTDCLCSSCHIAIHRKGSRIDHSFVFFDQCVCSECTAKPAIVRCVDCSDLFCSQCFVQQHLKTIHHRVQFATVPMCFHCRLALGQIACTDCNEVYCQECARRIHRRKTDHHHRKKIYGKFHFKLVATLADLAAIPSGISDNLEQAKKFAESRISL